MAIDLTQAHGAVSARLARYAGLRFFRLFSKALKGRNPGSKPPAGIEFQMLGEGPLCRHAVDPELDLSAARVKAACARGDVCVAATHRGGLAGYCWFAFEPLPHLDGVWVRFPENTVWTYKSFVRPAYRGLGIAPKLYDFAESLGPERGRDGSLICVESHNAPSVGAARRAGYEDSGRAGYVRRGAMFLGWYSQWPKSKGVGFFLPHSRIDVDKANVTGR